MSTTYTIKAGQKLSFSVPCQPDKGWGEFPSTNEYAVLGWTVDDAAAGTLTKQIGNVDKGCAVVYTHSSSIKGNVLTFTAVDGRKEHVVLVLPSSSTIHDHSTLEQGGPAFGTYASLLDEEIPA